MASKWKNKQTKKQNTKKQTPQQPKHRRNAPNPSEPEASDLASRLPFDLDLEELQRLAEMLGIDFEIIGPDVEDEFDDFDDFDDLNDFDETGAPMRATISVEQLIDLLVHEPELPATGQLYALSDLSRADTDLLRKRWEQIPVSRRRAVVNELVNLAEVELNLSLDRMLRIAMTDPDAEVRQVAVRGLWEDYNVDLLGPLVQMLLNDPAIDVRAAAATALGRYVLAGELEEMDSSLSMRAEEALLAVHADAAVPLEVRRRALEAIAFSGEVGVRQLIEDAYYSPDEPMRVSALFAMGRSADIRWRPLVRAELRNPSSAMRVEAAIACGELETRAALDDLLTLLHDRNQEVRLASIFALGRIGGEDAQDALEMVLASENAQEVEAAEAALEEMQFYADLNAVALFDEVLDEEEEWIADDEEDWYDLDDRELGEYDPDADEWDDDELNDDLADDDLDNNPEIGR
jgi:HEAT repeat protein